jgi:myo-inositol-1(or 4)-monophosphatase
VAHHSDLLTVARDAAERAAEYIRGAARPDASRWDRKGRSDFVTDIDRTAEQMIAGVLRAGVPGSTVVGEESAAGAAAAAEAPGVTWVVDPLDGTTNFLHDYPMYAVSVAALENGAPVAGVVVDVVRRLTYEATAGGGARCGNRPLRVSTVTDPALALLGTGFPFKAPGSARLEEYLRQFRRLLRATSGIRRCGSAALDLSHLAEGRLDGFWEIGLAAWDVAAGILLIREAGGLVTDFTGRPALVAPGDFVAGPAAIHQWLLAELAG